MHPVGKPRAYVWRFYERLSNGKRVKAKCKFCSHEYVTHPDRMKNHLVTSCSMCPASVREKLCNDVSTNKRRMPTSPKVSKSRSQLSEANGVQFQRANNLHNTDVTITHSVSSSSPSTSNWIYETFDSTAEATPGRLKEKTEDGDSVDKIEKTLPSKFDLELLDTEISDRDHNTHRSYNDLFEMNVTAASATTPLCFRQNCHNSNLLLEGLGIAKMPHASPGTMSASSAKSSSQQTQVTDKIFTKEKASSKLHQLFAKATYSCDLPFNIVENPYFRNFFRQLSPIYSLPTQSDLAGYLLDEEMNVAQERIDNLISEAPFLSIVSSSCRNTHDEDSVDFMVTSPQPVFFNFLNATECCRTHEQITLELKKIIQKLGPKKVFAVVTENTAKMKAAFDFVTQEYPHIQCYTCSIHTMQLIVNHVENLQTFSSHFSKMKNVFEYFRKNKPSVMFHHDSMQNSLTLPTSSCPNWPTSIELMQKIENCKQALQAAVFDNSNGHAYPEDIRTCVMDNNEFWWQNFQFCKMLQPIIDAISELKRDTCPLSEVHHQFLSIEQHIGNNINESPFSETEKQEIEAIVSLMKLQISTECHKAAYLLDPRFQGVNLSNDEFDMACDLIVKLACIKNVDCKMVLAEIGNFKAKSGLFSGRTKWEAVSAIDSINLTPSIWWRGFCPPCTLRNIAELLLTAPSSTSCIERYRSTWNTINSENKNKLGTATLEKLVSVKHFLKSGEKLSESEKQCWSDFSAETEELDNRRQISVNAYQEHF